MAKTIRTQIDMSGNAVLNPVLNPLAVAPQHANPFYIFTRTTDGKLCVNTGTYETPVWTEVGGGGSDVFWARYGTTTIEEILAAYDAHKLIFCCRNLGMYVLSYLSTTQAFFSLASVSEDAPCTLMLVLNSSGWSENTFYAPPKSHASTATTYGAGSSTDYGHVKLSDASDSTSSVTDGVAATPAAVKTAKDVADAALPKSGGTMTGAIAMGSNKITGLADGTDATDAVTKGQLDAAALGALKPKGSVAFASLPALTAAYVNCVYNVTDSFTTTADFVEGAGKAYPAGTNVAIINVGTDADPTYKYDVYGSFIDLSNIIKTATGTIGTSDTTTTVNFTGTLINAYATMNGAMIMLDIAPGASSVVFTVAQAPSAAVTCTVVYA